MKTETNVKPLYKVLNEQRTRDIFIALPSIELRPIRLNGDGLKRIANFDFGIGPNIPTQTEAEANAQYTALAVNNFHILAETLERLIDRIEENELQSYFPSAHARAKEALKRIS